MKRYQRVDEFLSAALAEDSLPGPILIDEIDDWEVRVNRRIVEVGKEGRLASYALDVDHLRNGWQYGMAPQNGLALSAMQYAERLALGIVSRIGESQNQNSYWIWCPSMQMYSGTSIAFVVSGDHRSVLMRLIEPDQLVHLHRDAWLSFGWSQPRRRGQNPLIRNLVGGEFAMPLDTRAEIIAAGTADGAAVLEGIAEKEGVHAWML